MGYGFPLFLGRSYELNHVHFWFPFVLWHVMIRCWLKIISTQSCCQCIFLSVKISAFFNHVTDFVNNLLSRTSLKPDPLPPCNIPLILCLSGNVVSLPVPLVMAETTVWVPEFTNKTEWLTGFFHILGFKKYTVVNFTHLFYIRDFSGISSVFLTFKREVLMFLKMVLNIKLFLITSHMLAMLCMIMHCWVECVAQRRGIIYFYVVYLTYGWTTNLLNLSYLQKSKH